jgi:hypothetical protein
MKFAVNFIVGAYVWFYEASIDRSFVGVVVEAGARRRSAISGTCHMSQGLGKGFENISGREQL